MNNKQYEAAKRLIDIPDVKKGSYGFIGDSTITYADIRILLDYIKDLEQENQKYKEVFDKVNSFLDKHDKNAGKLYYKYDNKYLLSEIKEDIRDILEEVE